MADRLIPAAQYLRMSTEHQQYSIDNQREVIAAWAALNRYEIVRTYEDRGKSGLAVKKRIGLQHLLADVAENPPFESVLVYDVSRWGRFQDSDEAAHYEFLCTAAGVPIHYCAESFRNDGNIPSLLMKALKRIMAGEYSRDLSLRVRKGIEHIVELGFNTGGTAPYGYRRLLVSANGESRWLLRFGDRKMLATDRVKLILGPEEEVRCVRLVFDLALKGKGPTDICRELAERGITRYGQPWDKCQIRIMLRNPKYAGINTWARTKSYTVGGIRVRVPRENWITKPNTIPAIVDPEMFRLVQDEIIKVGLSDDLLLSKLYRLLQKEGQLSPQVINAGSRTDLLPCVSTYRLRFGSLLDLYTRLGLPVSPAKVRGARQRLNSMRLHNDLLEKIVELFPQHFQIEAISKLGKKFLRVDGNMALNVMLCSRFNQSPRRRYLLTSTHASKDACPILMCTLNDSNTEIESYYLSRHAMPKKVLVVSASSALFQRALRLDSLAQLYCGLCLRFRNEL